MVRSVTGRARKEPIRRVIRDDDIVVVVRIQAPRDEKLTLVVDANDAQCLLLGSSESRQKQTCKNRDDGDDDKKFDESEPTPDPSQEGNSAASTPCGSRTGNTIVFRVHSQVYGKNNTGGGIGH